MNMNKIIRVGSTRGSNNTFCRIEIKDGNLSITGVESPMRNGNCMGGCGQINPVSPTTLAKGWDFNMLKTFNEIWERWHLNDMNAGNIQQEGFIRKYKKENPDWKYNYDDVCDLLLKAKIYEMDGYKYGHGWIKEEHPYSVIKFLSDLPDSDQEPHWV